jgi:hypothetical protein
MTTTNPSRDSTCILVSGRTFDASASQMRTSSGEYRIAVDLRDERWSAPHTADVVFLPEHPAPGITVLLYDFSFTFLSYGGGELRDLYPFHPEFASRDAPSTNTEARADAGCCVRVAMNRIAELYNADALDWSQRRGARIFVEYAGLALRTD